MPELKKNNSFLNDNHIQIFIPAIIIIFTAFGFCYAPKFLHPLFNGPDGTRWISPFLLMMGTLAGIYCLIPAFNKKISFISERFIAGAVVLFFTGMLLFVTVQRFSSGLRYLETYNEIMAIRLAQGVSMYPNPETAPVGSVYTPFFFIVCSIFHKLLPAGYGYGRLISFISVLLTALFVHKIVRQRNGSKAAGVWGAAVFLSTYAPLAMLYDQSCVDTLLMFLTVLCLFFFLKNRPLDDLYALMWGGLACFTKQSAAYPFMVILIFLIISRRKLWVYSPLVFWAGVAAILLFITNGWAYTYLVAYPAGHGFRDFPPSYLLYRFFMLQTLLWIALIYMIIKQRQARFFAYSLAVLVASFFGIYKSGGGLHPFFPFEPLLCIAAVPLLMRYKIVLACQLLLGLYNPFKAIYPWATIRNPDKEIVAMTKAAQGEVWLPTETYLYSRTEKKEWDNFCALFGPVWAGKNPPQRLLEALEQKKFELILMRKNSTDLFRLFHPAIIDLIKKQYIREETETLVIYRRRG